MRGLRRRGGCTSGFRRCTVAWALVLLSSASVPCASRAATGDASAATPAPRGAELDRERKLWLLGELRRERQAVSAAPGFAILVGSALLAGILALERNALDQGATYGAVAIGAGGAIGVAQIARARSRRSGLSIRIEALERELSGGPGAARPCRPEGVLVTLALRR